MSGSRSSSPLRWLALRDRARSSLWFVPMVCVLGSLGLAAATAAYDRSSHTVTFVEFQGAPDSARSILTAISGSIVTLTALVFSITVVALQLASSQYSPRVLRAFLRDRRSQLVLGAFLGTFTYSLVVLRSVRGSDLGGSAAYVPGLSVHVAFILTGLSLALFVFYVHHIAQAMQPSSILAEVASETADVLRGLPEAPGDFEVSEAGAPMERTCVVHSPHPSGYVEAVDEDALQEQAAGLGAIVRLVPMIGEFVPEGSALYEVGCPVGERTADVLCAAVRIGPRRSMQQDVLFGFRQIVDVAERALSPGLNDPTTAVEAIDRLHELLLLVANRQLPPSARAAGAGVVVVHRPTWDDYVHLSFDEIRQYGAGSIQVLRRLKASIIDLLDVVPASHRPVLEQQLELLDRAAARSFPDEEDVRLARRPSRHG